MSKAVMTIHGFMTVKEDFGRLYDHLDCYDEVLAVEIPGHNGKAKMDEFNVEDTMNTVLSCYDKLRSKHDQVDVVGFSMGGALTTWLCGQRDVHRAVVLAPANKYLNFFMPLETVKFYNEHGLKPLLDKKSEHTLAEKQYEIKKVFTTYFENVVASVKLLAGNVHEDKVITPRIYNVFRKIIKQCNKIVEEHTPIQTPLLVLWGKLDELVPHKSVQYVLDHFVNSEFKIYDDLGHAMLYTNHDDLLITDTMKFLTEGAFCKTVSHRDLPVIHDESEETE